jgi:hypothetical protein
MFTRYFLRTHKVSFAIFIFLVIFGFIHLVKPGFIYNQDGGFRPFGVGYRNKTVVPIWLVSICIAILSYLFILWATHYSSFY